MSHRSLTIRLAAAVFAAGLVATCASATARTLQAGKGRQYETPSAAISAASDGDTVVIDPGSYFDCAVVTANHLTITGASADGAATLTDKMCQGKALLVITGHDVTVRNMTLTRGRVPDYNGAGIRAEGANLTVDGVHFINNQDGILAGNSPGSTITIRNSEFVKNGTCVEACAHGIYVNNVALLRIEHSRFFQTKQAHHIKSRALRTEVTDTTIEDGPEGTASYEIDISNGGSLIVRGCTIEKGPKNENHTAAIRIGAEGVTNPTDEIRLENNSFTNDGPPTLFVDNLTATEAVLKHNTVHGLVTVLRGDGSVE